tara:strand:+ start:4675 stop:5922 length:1248 start_codon:yes stop_codon:yes gene_type:complete
MDLLRGNGTSNEFNLDSFPIWGYGIIHLLLVTKLNILIFQQLLNFIVIIKVDYFLVKLKKIRNVIFLRRLMIFSLPYFFFHTQMWPKSISASLLILGILQLFSYARNKKIKHLAFAGLLMGILSNFRSDYLVFIVFIIPLYVIFFEFYKYKKNILSSFKVFILPLITLVLLIPWGVYTYSKTNHFLINSTNTGHVLFIGLGQLPNNLWGISPRDDDFKMKKIIEKEFGENISSVSYNSNDLLKRKFLEFILKNPLEWFKKCFYSLRLIFFDPFYVGNVGDFQKNGISNIKEIRSFEDAIYRLDYSKTFSILNSTEWNFSKKEIFELMITILTKVIGIIIFFLTVILVLKKLFKYRLKAFFDYNTSVCILLILYQISISIFAFHMPVYNTSIYLIYIILIVLFFEKTSFNQAINSN